MYYFYFKDKEQKIIKHKIVTMNKLCSLLPPSLDEQKVAVRKISLQSLMFFLFLTILHSSSFAFSTPPRDKNH